jgi:putative transposase
MKTVPTVGLVEKADTVMLPDLPEEVALAMSDIAGAAREGFWR